MRPLHRKAATVLAIVSILALATPAMAKQEGSFFFKGTQTGTSASAQWGECTPDTPEPGLETCDFTSVNVMDGSVRFSSDLEQPGRTGSQACVDHQLSIQGPDSFELLSLQSGCTDTFTFTIAADLSTAHLVATVPVFDLECDEFSCEPVGDPIDTAVDVTWTVEGVQAVREKGNFHSLQNGLWCHSQFTRRGVGGFATATGSVGGVDLGPSEFADVFSGVQKFSDRCN